VQLTSLESVVNSDLQFFILTHNATSRDIFRCKLLSHIFVARGTEYVFTQLFSNFDSYALLCKPVSIAGPTDDTQANPSRNYGLEEGRSVYEGGVFNVEINLPADYP
jgi:hypothetical protein